MGEYAQAAIWAEMNGRDPTDMSPEDWAAFYAEYDAPKPAKKPHPFKCKVCGRKLKSGRGLRDHTAEKHAKPAVSERREAGE